MLLGNIEENSHLSDIALNYEDVISKVPLLLTVC